MLSKERIDQLDDRTVLLILSYLSQDLREELSDDQATSVRSENEARQAISALLNTVGALAAPVDTAEILPDDAAAVVVGRDLLKLLLEDEQLRLRVEELIADPPAETQMSVELALAGAVVLGTLITWLQTKVDLRVSRKDGKIEFEIKLHKDATEASVIKDVVQSVKTLLLGP